MCVRWRLGNLEGMKSRPPPAREQQAAVLTRIEQLEAEKAKLHAQSLAARAELAQLWEREHSGFAEMELAGTALIGQYRAARELTDATRADECFPRTRELLESGALFVPVAELLLAETRHCTPDVQVALDARVAPALVGRNMTDCRRLITATVLAVEAEIDPELTKERLDAAKESTRVWIAPGADGLTSIGALLDAVAGRRWTVDFEQLVKAQRTLDTRAGIKRRIGEVRAEVFANLPSLVLELVRAARDDRLAELTEVAALDPETARELAQLADDTRDLPLPEPDVDPATGEVRADPDPVDDTRLEELAALDPWRDLPAELSEVDPPPEDPPEAGPPPTLDVIQDAGFWEGVHRGTTVPARPPDPLVELLVLRCFQMPLDKPTVVNLHLPMATALDLSDAPGHLEGHGPVASRRIRVLLPTASLREIYVDQDTGVPLGAQRRASRAAPGQNSIDSLARRLRPVILDDVAEPQHDPSVALAEFVKLRDQRCSGPGCTMPAYLCDLDHEDEHPEGPTAEWNLDDKSRRCHMAKHKGWDVTRHGDGRSDWRSPLGRVYTSHSQWLPPPAPKRAPPGLRIHLASSRFDLEIETAH